MPYAFVLALLLAGCGMTAGSAPDAPAPPPADSGDAAGPPVDSLETGLTRLREAIRVEVGDAAASSPAACRTMPMGHKPCGGPASHLVYSTETSDEARLERLVTEYTEAHRAYNTARGLASDCALVPEPPVEWEGGRCVVGGN